MDDLSSVEEGAVRLGWSQSLGEDYMQLIPTINPQCEGYDDRFVCVSVTTLAATYLIYMLK